MNEDILKKETLSAIDSFQWIRSKDIHELSSSVLKKRFDAEMSAFLHVLHIYMMKNIDFTMPQDDVFYKFDRIANGLKDSVVNLMSNNDSTSIIDVKSHSKRKWSNPIYKQIKKDVENTNVCQ